MKANLVVVNRDPPGLVARSRTAGAPGRFCGRGWAGSVSAPGALAAVVVLGLLGYGGLHAQPSPDAVAPISSYRPVVIEERFNVIRRFDFPPAPKLNLFGKLDPARATPAERRGQDLFFGRVQCATCHPPPYYTDNSMHDLQTGRFFAPRLVRGAMMTADGMIKTFPLRGLKDSPPYWHDGRLLTLADTVEFFNLVLGTRLTPAEKADLEAFLRVL